MKKRFMLVAVLLGSLALASCVDDKESDSVTAIRNAKVERLKAAAALDYANAAREQAEAAIKQAKAEYDKQELAERLEKIKAEYAAAIELANSQAAASKQTAFNNASELLSDAYGKYEDAVGKLQGLNGTLIEKEVDLALATADSSKAEQTFKETMRQQELIIAQKKAQIERLNALAEVQDDKDALQKEMDDLAAAAYTLEKVDKVNAEQAIEAAQEKQETAWALVNPDMPGSILEPTSPALTPNPVPTMTRPTEEERPRRENYTDDPAGEAAFQNALQRWQDAVNRYDDAWSTYYNIGYNNRILMDIYHAQQEAYRQSLYDMVEYKNGLSAYVANALILNEYASEVVGVTPFFSVPNDPEDIAIEESLETEELLVFEPAAASTFETSRLAVERDFEDAIAYVKKFQIGHPESEEGAGDATGVEERILGAKEALKTAQENLKTAQEADEPDAEEITRLQRVVEDAQVALKRVEEEKEGYLADIKDYEEELAAFKKALAAVATGGDNEKAYQEAVKNYVAATQEVLKANYELKIIEDQIEEIGIPEWNEDTTPAGTGNGTYSQLAALWNGTADVKELIADCEAAIADAEKVIAKGASMSSGSISTGSWSSDSFTGSPADIIELLQMEIDILKEKITLQEAIVAEYKAALEAIINGED